MLDELTQERPRAALTMAQELEQAKKELKKRRGKAKLKKLETEDKAKADDEYPGLDKFLHDKAVIKPAATNAELTAFIERVECLELSRTELTADIKEIYAEAQSCGFDTKTMRKIVSLRKMEESDRLEADALLATYMRAVGMTIQTEMGF